MTSQVERDMKKRYVRAGKFIVHIDENGNPGKREDFKSNNAAKRESRRLQLAADGALGRGSVHCSRNC